MKVALLGLLLLSAAYAADYGLDCSFPIKNKEMEDCGLGDRTRVYEEFMQGCRNHYGRKGDRCDSTENDRIAMSIRQPQSMVNYTDTGFKKIKAPKAVMDLLLDHWERNQNNKKEEWPAGNIYVNHWASPTYMVSVEDRQLRGGGFQLKQAIWDAVKPTIEEWTGMELEPTSMYGIRVYTEGAILNPHVDRLPLVSSCIINVAQDVDEDWELEVFDRHDRAVNVTMEPGDMVLYESGSLVHGRPFPMKGRFYANVFIHFQPSGKKLNDHRVANEYLDELDDFYPPYILPNSPEQENWAKRNPQGWKRPTPSAPIQQASASEAHRAAARGELDKIAEIGRASRRQLRKMDINGWQPIHEAARAGHQVVVQSLIEEHGVDKNARYGVNGKGGSVLNLAREHLGAKHETVRYLEQIGAVDTEPEL